MKFRWLYLTILFFCSACSQEISIVEFKSFSGLPYTTDAWERALPNTRALMIYNYLELNQPINRLSKQKIEMDLGPSTTYFVQDFFPAYIVEKDGNKFVFAFSFSGSCDSDVALPPCLVSNVYIEPL